MVCLGVSLLEEVRGSGCRSGVLIVGVMATGVALGFGLGLEFTFSQETTVPKCDSSRSINSYSVLAVWLGSDYFSCSVSLVV